jgi:hypothetical protein
VGCHAQQSDEERSVCDKEFKVNNGVSTGQPLLIYGLYVRQLILRQAI